jgi:ABC-type branched-subunit amino acid transport system substrate-binding protein
MILLLEPKTAINWMGTTGAPRPKDFNFTQNSRGGIGAPQPLFTYNFARGCGDACDGMWLWTGYNPPIDRYQSNPAVATFKSDLKAQSASADEFNQFTMGGYLGMQVLIEAIGQTGPNLTRAALVDKLNSMAPVDSGLSVPLQWRPNARYANHSAQAFRIEARQGFSGWVLQQGYLRDKWLGEHTG